MMERVWIVAQQEFMTQVRQRSFLIMVFLFPILVGGLGVLSGSIGARQAEQTDTLGQIGVVDLAGVLADEHEKPEDYVTFAAAAAAADALEAGEIGAYFVVAADYMSSGAVNGFAREPIGMGIQSQFKEYLLANLLAERSAQEAELLRDPAQISLATVDGTLMLPEETGIYMIMAPIFVAIILVLSINMTASTMMQSVVEEKETRMVEILATTITPLQLLTGKILALLALGMLQIVVWGLAAVLILRLRPDAAELLSGLRYPGWLLAVAVAYLVLGYLLFGTLLAGIGASSSSMQEAQPLSGVFSLLGVIPLFFLGQFLENPNGALPVFLSLLPFTAPTAMIVRLVLGVVPLWQLGLSLAILAATTGVILWLGAWVFRVGLLMTGNRLTPRALAAAIRRGQSEAGAVATGAVGTGG